ncbi:MAG: 3-phosphoserine/phosphohydroxythreonine transaminase [bacterium]|nr:3-phosphoserine/phosphohydroxythreonine transaminase [bacterium]
MARVFNFSAGPAALPLAALEKAQAELLELPGAGASVMEISHRSKQFTAIIETAQSNIKSLYAMPDNYQVLFVQGGASLQFSILAMNFLRGATAPADYVLTGSWGNKAIKEAKKEGAVNVAWDGKDDNFVRVPTQDELNLTAGAPYLHLTSNETIQGVEFFTEPDTGDVPLICDASSDILSRPVDVSKYGMIYAGAQKNIGPSGVALVIIRDDLLARVPDGLPSLLDYKNLASAGSLFNTPPTFAIYMIKLVTDWLVNDIGGLDKMEAINREKASMLYGAIDNSDGFYRGHAQVESRSIMNVAWRLPSEELEQEFIASAADSGLAALKGHRSVGGIRASIYNAMPVEGVKALCDFMAAFQKQKG